MTTRSGRFTWALMALGATMALMAGTSPVAAKTFKNPRKMKFPPLGEIRTPEIDRQLLDNGMVVYLLEDHDFPMVDFQMMVRAASIYEPEPLRGLARITGEVLRTGGTAQIPGDELDEKLESMGAYIESHIGETNGSVSGSFLSEDGVEGLRLLGDLLRQPVFPDEKIELAKVNLRTEIASRNDEPIPIAIREFRKLMAGEHSPYGWYPEYETVAAISRSHIVQFHQAFFHPDGMILTVSGDFDSAKMLSEIRRIFGDWPASGSPLPPDPPVSEKSPTGVYHAQKEDVTQSTVLFGLKGTLASDPDYAALQLLNDILGGGGFSSRLVNEIRSKRGLAYAVGSAPGTGWHHPGVWVCYLLAQADSTMVGAELMRKEVDRIVQEPVTETELQRAKDSVLNELVFDLSSKRQVLNRKAFYEFYGYPADFLEQYQEKVRTLTTADLLAVAQRHIHPEEMAVLLVGPKGKFDAPLETLGSVNEIDITIPDPPSKLDVPEATPESLEGGRRILKAALAAHGGASVAKVRTLRQEGNGSMTMMGQTMSFALNTLRVLPDRAWAKIDIGGMFTIVRVGDGDGGWTKTPQGVMDRMPEEIEEARLERIRTPFHFLAHWEEMTWQGLEPQEIEGTLCEAVYARDSDVKEWILYFDAKTHLLRAMDYASRGQQGPMGVREFLNDYRKVGGVRIPHAFKSLHDGDPFMELNLKSIEVNVPVDEALFKRPE
ncbi:MAG: insulinase family protein [Candidatus Eisenbacteria sp.]|nr:insulinase family protein [Candidatus Eisenbacteria bacterium]